MRGKRSVVILGNDGLYGGFVVIGYSRRQNGGGKQKQGDNAFHRNFPKKVFIEKKILLTSGRLKPFSDGLFVFVADTRQHTGDKSGRNNDGNAHRRHAT